MENLAEMEKLIKLIVDLKLESSTLMWAFIAYFAMGFAKSLLGYALLGVIGIYWAKTVKYLVERRANQDE